MADDMYPSLDVYSTRGRLASRRIPVMTAVALTNLVASTLLVHHNEFEQGPIFDTLRDVAPYQVWGVTFLAIGVFATVVIMTRWALGSVIAVLASSIVWTVVVVGSLATVLTTPADLSPLGQAIYTFLLSGHLSVLFALTWVPHRRNRPNTETE